MSEDNEYEKRNWIPLIGGLILLVGIDVCIFNINFFGIDLKKYPENFLVALLILHVLILMFGILVIAGYKFSLKDGKINAEMRAELIEMKDSLGKKITPDELSEFLSETQAPLKEGKEFQQTKITSDKLSEFSADNVNNTLSKDTNQNTSMRKFPKLKEDARGILFDTNKAYDETAVWDMMSRNRISAYNDAVKQVNRLQKDDIIFFYHKEAGIIAAGIVVSDKPTNTKYNGDSEEYNGDPERYHTVEFLTQIPQQGEPMIALPYNQIKNVARSFYLASTVKVPYLYGEKEWGSLLEAVIERVGKPS